MHYIFQKKKNWKIQMKEYMFSQLKLVKDKTNEYYIMRGKFKLAIDKKVKNHVDYETADREKILFCSSRLSGKSAPREKRHSINKIRLCLF